MIIMLMFLIMVIIGFILIEFDNGSLDILGILMIGVGGACLMLSIIIISINNLTADLAIQNNRIEYDGLCRRLEIINSDYEDVSKSDVIADIAAWNISVSKAKYWSYNPWTNWYNPKCIADNLNYIPLSNEEDK